MRQDDENPPDTTGRKQVSSWFKPGKSGNPLGRPVGSKHRLAENFISAVHDDFLAHGMAAIVKVRAENPVAYLRIIVSIIPREIHVADASLDDLSDEELLAMIRSMIGNESEHKHQRKPQVNPQIERPDTPTKKLAN